MGPDGVNAFGVDVLPVLVRQFESGAEFGLFEGGEGCGELVGNMGSVFGAAVICAIGDIANYNSMFSVVC